MKHSSATPPSIFCKAQKPWGFGPGPSTLWSWKWVFLRVDLVQGFAVIKLNFRVNERSFTTVLSLPNLGVQQSICT